MLKITSMSSFDSHGGLRFAVHPTIRKVGSAALLSLLTSCGHSIAPGQVFDYQGASAQSAQQAASTRTSGRTEQPRSKVASAALRLPASGPGYSVSPTIASDGRYRVYAFTTEYGAYSVTGDELARHHVRELIALDALKKYSPPGQFVRGAGTAVVNPIKGVFRTVTDPVGSAKGAYGNVSRRIGSVRRGLSDAGEFVTTFGNPEKKRPERENENLVEKIVDRPKEKRRLADTLGVDPNTHFLPLSKELNTVASYSVAGSFGVNRGLGFIPGAAGTVISSLGTLDSLTNQTLDMPPDEIAAANRERLQTLNIPEDAIRRFLLSDKLTPTEKTRTVGYLSSMSGTPGLGVLTLYVASSETRVGAYAAMQTVGYLSTRPFVTEPISSIENVEGVPVVSLGANKKVALLSADDLAWTPENATQLGKLDTALANGNNARPRRNIWISGNASPMAKRELQRRGWIVKSNTFGSLR